MFVKMSLCHRLICFADFVGMTLLVACRTPMAPFFFVLPLSNCLPTHFAAVLKFILPLTTSAISGAATSNTYTFCSWDDIFWQNWICSSPIYLCKCTESRSTLSTKTSIERNLYLSWSNHLVTSFRLKLNVGGFCEHQNKTSETDI